MGFVLNQDIKDSGGKYWRAGTTLDIDVMLPVGTTFNFPFIMPAGLSLSDRFTPREDETELQNDKLYLTSTFWDGPKTVTCTFPCIIVFPPWTTTTTWAPAPYTLISSGVTTTVPIPPFTSELIKFKSTTISSTSESDSSQTLLPIPLPKPLCVKVVLPILGQIQVGICPPKLDPFPPAINIPTVTVVKGTVPGPTPVANEKSKEQKEQVRT